MEVQVQAAEILKRPYARILTPDPDGRVTAEIMEFPGCVAYGNNNVEALARLEEVAVEWIDAALEQGQEIPEPMDNAEYSGRLGLRMTRGLHKRASICADREGVSLNQFINTCLAEAVGERARPSIGLSVQPQIQATTTLNIQMTSGIGTATITPVELYAGNMQPGLVSAYSSNQPVVFPVKKERERQRA